MDAVLDFARGPFFRLALAVMLLGTLRQVALTLAGYVEARNRAGDKNIDAAGLVVETFRWLFPLRYIRKRGMYSLLSFAFHVGLILVPLFFSGHIRLWKAGLGLSWASLPGPVADWLTILTVSTGLALIAGRLYSRESRALSRFQDWLFTPLIVLVFATGYLAAHPAANPLTYKQAVTIHVLGGDLIMLSLPFSKLVHCLVLPFSRYVNDMGWRFVPGSGEAVVTELGKEGKPI